MTVQRMSSQYTMRATLGFTGHGTEKLWRHRTAEGREHIRLGASRGVRVGDTVPPKKHRTNIIVTSLMGKWYQAECSCGWLSPRSYAVRRYAERDAREHKRGNR